MLRVTYVGRLWTRQVGWRARWSDACPCERGREEWESLVEPAGWWLGFLAGVVKIVGGGMFLVLVPVSVWEDVARRWDDDDQRSGLRWLVCQTMVPSTLKLLQRRLSDTLWLRKCVVLEVFFKRKIDKVERILKCRNDIFD